MKSMRKKRRKCNDGLRADFSDNFYHRGFAYGEENTHGGRRAPRLENGLKEHTDSAGRHSHAAGGRPCARDWGITLQREPETRRPAPSDLVPSSPQRAAPGVQALLERCAAKLRGNPPRLALTDGEDQRAVSAAVRLARDGLALPVLLGKRSTIEILIRQEADLHGASGAPVTIVDPAEQTVLEKNTAAYQKILHEKNKSANEAENFMRGGPAAGAMMVRLGEAEIGVGGNLSPTADVLRAGLRILGTAPGSDTVSGAFFMISPDREDEKSRVFIFSDASVVPEPTSEQLADIAVDSARQYAKMTGDEPRVALLSFSSRGSANHPRAEFVRGVAAMVRQKAPDLIVDGEVQFDAAVVPEVAEAKIPGRPLGGRANVLIFPSLEAGNIGYKIAQRLGGYTALGPFLQGLNGGWLDLSRGCDADDIRQTAIIGAALQRG